MNSSVECSLLVSLDGLESPFWHIGPKDGSGPTAADHDRMWSDGVRLHFRMYRPFRSAAMLRRLMKSVRWTILLAERRKEGA